MLSRRQCPPNRSPAPSRLYAKADLLPPISGPLPSFLRKGFTNTPKIALKWHYYSQKMAGRESLPILLALHEGPSGVIAVP